MSSQLNHQPEGPGAGQPSPKALTPEQARLLQESLQAAFEPVQTMSASLSEAEIYVPKLPSVWPGLMPDPAVEHLKAVLNTHAEIRKADSTLPEDVERGLDELLAQESRAGFLGAEILSHAKLLLGKTGTDRFETYIWLTGDGSDTLQTLYLARLCTDHFYAHGLSAFTGLWEKPAFQPFKEARSWNAVGPTYEGIAKMVERGADPKEVKTLVGLGAHIAYITGRDSRGFEGVVEDLDELGRCEQNIADGDRPNEMILPSCGHEALDIYAQLAAKTPGSKSLSELALAGDFLAGAISLRSLRDHLAGRESALSIEDAQLGAAGWLRHHAHGHYADAERAAKLLGESVFGRLGWKDTPSYTGTLEVSVMSRPPSVSTAPDLFERASIYALAAEPLWDALTGSDEDMGRQALLGISAALDGYETGVGVAKALGVARDFNGGGVDLTHDWDNAPYDVTMNQLYEMIANPETSLRHSWEGAHAGVLGVFVKHIQKAQALGITWKTVK